jgi:hypothetical protein
VINSLWTVTEFWQISGTTSIFHFQPLSQPQFQELENQQPEFLLPQISSNIFLNP